MANIRKFSVSIGLIGLAGSLSDGARAETPLHHGPTIKIENISISPRSAERQLNLTARRLEKACKQKNGAACVTLGQILAVQKQAIADRMLKYYKVACDVGHADGCYASGKLLMQSQIRSYAEQAALLFTKGCDAGSAAACYHLSGLLNDGDLIPQNRERARAAEARGAELLRAQGLEFAVPIRRPAP